mmetsp:Transcript_6581/g.19398  ORF Transcript_6581/g.19398 Transcript_6581/m.19398 type:complete len:213 (-) Transcript_6581:1157-1795(-)
MDAEVVLVVGPQPRLDRVFVLPVTTGTPLRRVHDRDPPPLVDLGPDPAGDVRPVPPLGGAAPPACRSGHPPKVARRIIPALRGLLRRSHTRASPLRRGVRHPFPDVPARRPKSPPIVVGATARLMGDVGIEGTSAHRGLPSRSVLQLESVREEGEADARSVDVLVVNAAVAGADEAEDADNPDGIDVTLVVVGAGDVAVQHHLVWKSALAAA